MAKIGVVGAGAWGTALAMVACRAGNDVTLQAREPEVVQSINEQHKNFLYLPDVTMDAEIRATQDVADVIDADAVMLVAPTQHLRSVAKGVADIWPEGTPAIICAKGIEQESCALLSEAVAETLPQAPVAILSGPTFAIEVARDLPTAVTLATQDEQVAITLVDHLNTNRFRIYRSDDVIGAQIGGAVKNVLAISLRYRRRQETRR